VLQEVASGREQPEWLLQLITSRGESFLGSGPGLEPWAMQVAQSAEAAGSSASGRAEAAVPAFGRVRFLDAGAELVLHDLARWLAAERAQARSRGRTPVEVAPLVAQLSETYANGLRELTSRSFPRGTVASASRSLTAYAGPGRELTWDLITRTLSGVQAGTVAPEEAIGRTTRLLALVRSAADTVLRQRAEQDFSGRYGKRRASQAGLDGPGTADGESVRAGKRRAVANEAGEPSWAEGWGRPGERQAATGDRALPALPVFRRTGAMTALASLLTGDRPVQEVRQELLSAVVARAGEVALDIGFSVAAADASVTDAAGVRLLDIGVQLTLHDLESEPAATAAGRGAPAGQQIDPAGRGLAEPADLVPLLQRVYRERLEELLAGEAADAEAADAAARSLQLLDDPAVQATWADAAGRIAAAWSGAGSSQFGSSRFGPLPGTLVDRAVGDASAVLVQQVGERVQSLLAGRRPARRAGIW
jgi:hypothetical protein